MQVRLNNFIAVRPYKEKLQINTPEKLITIEKDKFCIDLINKIIRKQNEGKDEAATVDKRKAKKNKVFNRLLKEKILIEAGCNEPEETRMIFNYFKNPNFNGVKITLKKALEITKRAHPKKIPWVSKVMPKNTRYSCREFRNQMIATPIFKKYYQSKLWRNLATKNKTLYYPYSDSLGRRYISSQNICFNKE